ncbi:Suppressor Mra1 family protein [Ferroglobus placidus DSM 10642]|uniref:Ribosomal RNA small subunit methyltransferase Nep1 n=1 Tax=Ferroglobus placidus (strain DSM 10642 / AEDII12DO) TaxID=589924 RepID=D3S196_FERPA|nr:16S rRNA methyltransferase [Ferroglobus placidus]ADC64332.1 Suppressor Mra1 family protein [Ferroglobus placidus DSM 10642]
MMRVVLVESSLELIPEKIQNHPAVISDSRRRKKKPKEMILDDSKHHAAMKNLPKREKRGRPDIVHSCLLSLIDSAVENLEIYIHTINNEVIRVNRETRIPRNYNRFIGLFEQLYKEKRIEANGKVLLEIVDESLENILRGEVIVMREGESLDNFKKALNSEEITVCIGAFPHGDFEKETYEVFGKVDAKFAGFGEVSRTSLYVVNRVLALYEISKGIIDFC